MSSGPASGLTGPRFNRDTYTAPTPLEATWRGTWIALKMALVSHTRVRQRLATETPRVVVKKPAGVTLEQFQRAAEGKRGKEALHAIGEAYAELLARDPSYLRGQMQAYAACDDPEICTEVRHGYGDLVAYVERVSDADPQTVSAFFAKGMLMNVLSSMFPTGEPTEPWAQRLLDGCRES